MYRRETAEKAWGEKYSATYHPPIRPKKNQIKKLEASIENAMRGNWRETPHRLSPP